MLMSRRSNPQTDISEGGMSNRAALYICLLLDLIFCVLPSSMPINHLITSIN